ncbi:uncharacterized protein [Palaemon carinicauda]|uniref:uncharacterized protein n=1 Tax=Palaemon carinicauda TaxID=392227 RepID=UPI0035B67BEA
MGACPGFEVKEYKDLKKTVLDAYAITVEGYRQTFRNSFKTQSQTFVEFCNIKVRQFNKWLERAGVNDLDSLKNLILLEEFLRKVPSNIATCVHFKGEIEVLKAASLADDYYLIHKNSKDSSKIVSSPKSHQVSCAYCKKDGHSIENCPSPKCQKSEVSTDGKSKKSKGAVTCHAFVHSQDLEPFNEFMCEASLNDSSVTALRDSASSQTIISAASQDNLKYTKEYIAVSDLTTTTLLPEAEVDIACPYFTGKAKVAVLDKPLPCYPIQMIIGNDLAGSSVLKPKLIVTTPEVVIKDELSKKPGKISQVITRSSSKMSSTNFPPKVKNDRITEALDLVDIKKDQFAVLQQKDSSLKALWDKVVDPTDNPKTPYFYVEKNILFRHYKSPKAPTSNSWHDCFQVVFPEPLRKPLLDLAHSTESHLGVNKTYKRLFEDFYWPEMRKDIKEFIASCHHCQITGKPNEKIPPAPLQSIPVPKSPFDKTNGALERMHQTLKSLLRKYISETSQHWDEDLDLLMYVLRCTPHDSTGVSPFELMFGRKPRTILSSVKENILQRKPEETTNIYQYLKELKKKFTYIYDIATTNLVSSQQKMQNIYNKKAKMREFKTDDQVLVYHPIPGAPLREKYAGPYKIVHRTSKVNYIISTPDRKRQTQLVHVNLLKPYITPVKKVSPNIALVITKANTEVTKVPNLTIDEETNDGDETNLILSFKDFANSEILKSLSSYLSHLYVPQKQALKSLLLKFPDISTDIPKCSSTVHHDILLEPNTTPIRQPFYRATGVKLETLKREVQYLLDNNLAEPSTSPWASPCILVPKPNGQFRLCTDYRKLNKVTIKDSYPLPMVNDILDNIRNTKFLTQIDLLKGYYQVPLTDKAKKISSFVTPFGLFSYLVMPFGLCNAPATFQRMMAEITRGLKDVFAYLDDIVIASKTWEEHLSTLEELFQRLQKVGLTINLAKSSFGQAKVVYLGHCIGSGEIIPKGANIDNIKNIPIPATRQQLKSFLGMVSYYAKFIKNFAVITAPLYALTSPKVKFDWTEEHCHIFKQLKSILVSKPLLRAADFNKEFFMQIDASNTGYGAVLLQSYSVGTTETPPPLHHLLPIAYHSRFFKGAQTRWATVEKELYAIIASLLHFQRYLEGHHRVLVYTDHRPLIFLERSLLRNNKLLRWSYILSAFNLQLQSIGGTNNLIADTLSRLPPPSTPQPSSPTIVGPS